MKILFHWIFSALAILIAAYIVPDVSVTISGALIAAVVLGALNLFIRPIIFILTLPINIITLGLFSLVVNALLVIAASSVVPEFTIHTFWDAFLFAFALAVVNWVFNLWDD